jgi:hypothetical protein
VQLSPGSAAKPPPPPLPLIAEFALLFSKPVWENAKLLFVVTILAPGKRTITAASRFCFRLLPQLTSLVYLVIKNVQCGFAGLLLVFIFRIDLQSSGCPHLQTGDFTSAHLAAFRRRFVWRVAALTPLTVRVPNAMLSGATTDARR